MDKELIANTLKKLKENSPKRNFKQSIDLIINLKDLDLKKPEHQINTFVALHHDTGRKVSVCALVDTDLESKAKEVCDETILQDQFNRFKGKAEIKKLANKHDFFIAQASIMPKIATVFGRYLGPRGKMPNPKIGSVLPPDANIKLLCGKLRKTINLVTKNEPTIKCMVGKEDTADGTLIDNVLTVYSSIVQKLPNEKHNVKSVMLKLTMGPAFIIGAEKKEDKKGKGKAAKKPETKAGEKQEEVKEQIEQKEAKAKKEESKPKAVKNKSKETEKQSK